MSLDTGQFQLKSRPDRQEWDVPPFWMEICDAFLPMKSVDEFFGMEPSRNLAFTGPAGTGKTTAAFYMAGSLMDRGYQLFLVSGTDLADREESDVRRLLHVLLSDPPGALSSGKCIVFRYPDQGGKAGTIYGTLNEFLHAEAVGYPVVLILVTENLEACPAIREYFFELPFHIPNDQERERFLKNEVFGNFTFSGQMNGLSEGNQEDTKEDEAALRRLVDETDGFDYHMLSSLEFAFRLVRKRALQKKFRFEEKEILDYLSGMGEAEKQYISKEELDEIVELFSSARRRNQTLTVTGSMLRGEADRMKGPAGGQLADDFLNDDESADDLTWNEMMRAVGIKL